MITKKELQERIQQMETEYTQHQAQIQHHQAQMYAYQGALQFARMMLDLMNGEYEDTEDKLSKV